MRFQTFKTPTRVCKICFKEIHEISLNSIVKPQYSICSDCYRKLPLIYKKFNFEGVDCLALYEYEEFMKQIIYQFKGCFDYELKNVFLERFKNELKLLFMDYILVPVPSSKVHDELRGFNHVEEAFSCLGLKFAKIISKTENIKQSDRNAEERKEIDKILSDNGSMDLSGKKVLIVDDIMTTGSTLKACISLVKKHHPTKISALVLCKTRDLDFSKNSNINKLY